MSDDEFWKSTMAKVFALVDAHNEHNKIRDYFPAMLISNKLNQMPGDHVFTPDEILAHKYRASRPVATTLNHDPNQGALGDWQSLKAGLKKMTYRGTHGG